MSQHFHQHTHHHGGGSLRKLLEGALAEFRERGDQLMAAIDEVKVNTDKILQDEDLLLAKLSELPNLVAQNKALADELEALKSQETVTQTDLQTVADGATPLPGTPSPGVDSGAAGDLTTHGADPTGGTLPGEVGSTPVNPPADAGTTGGTE